MNTTQFTMNIKKKNIHKKNGKMNASFLSAESSFIV